MKKCLVTGGAGFIGSHLVDRLVADGHQVSVLDNFATGCIENLAQHDGSRKVAVCTVDVSDEADMARVSGYKVFDGVDWVFHLAALADIIPSIKYPLKYWRANVDGTVNVLEASRLAKVKRFVYVASSSCYGIPDEYPTPETAEIRPQYPYALSKRVGELAVMHWGKVYGLPVVSLRVFNAYGLRARANTYGAVFGVFLAQKLHGKPFTVVGDGSQTRDFIWVDDVVDALVKSAESDVSGEVLNVGSGQTYSIDYLTRLMGHNVVYMPERPGEPDCTWADISKAKRLLGWKPKVAFKEGVQVMLDHIEDWRDAPVWTPGKIGDATKEWFQYLKGGVK